MADNSSNQTYDIQYVPYNGGTKVIYTKSTPMKLNGETIINVEEAERDIAGLDFSKTGRTLGASEVSAFKKYEQYTSAVSNYDTTRKSLESKIKDTSLPKAERDKAQSQLNSLHKPQLSDSNFNLSTTDLTVIKTAAKSNNLSDNLSDPTTMSKLPTYMKPEMLATEIKTDMPGYMDRVLEGEKIQKNIDSTEKQITQKNSEIASNETKMQGLTDKINKITQENPIVVESEEGVVAWSETAQANYRNFLSSPDYDVLVNYQRKVKAIEMDETLSSEQKVAAKADLDNRLTQAKVRQAELKTDVENSSKAAADMKTYQDAVRERQKLDEKTASLRQDVTDLNKTKQDLEADKADNEAEKQAYSISKTGTVRDVNKSVTDAEKAGKPAVAQGSGSGSFANPGQDLNKDATYYNITRNENSETYTIKGSNLSSDSIIDIEQYRYYKSDESKRIGYTLLSCGDYLDNVYNNGNSGNKGYNQINGISFILPMPDGSIKLSTSTSWSDQDENGMNEAAQEMMHSNEHRNNSSVALAGFNKAVQGFLMQKAGNLGINGALRGTGLAYNPNKQLYFEGVGLETFEYSFSFVPKNQDEAIKIKIFSEAINILMLPGTTVNGNNISALKIITNQLFNNASGAVDSIKKSLNGDNNKSSAIDNLISGAFGLVAGGGRLLEYFSGGDSNGLSSPYFSYPGLWTIGVYVPTANASANDFCILEHNRLALTNCNLTFGGNNAITWHSDGFPTVMKITLSFKESQYRTKENMHNLVSMLGGGNNYKEYSNKIQTQVTKVYSANLGDPNSPYKDNPI